MTIFEIMVTGSRIWTDKRRVWRVLDEVVEQARSADPDVRITLLHGGAAGADEMAAAWAENRGHTSHAMHARWKTEGKAAGVIRNQRMVATGPNVVVAFRANHSRGTTDAIERAHAAGITLRIEEATVEYPLPKPRRRTGL